MVYYRKYRPQTIEELDSVEVREKLTKLLSGKLIPHAFLFTGPKGLGKTSTARIIAKYINCVSTGKQKPCNKCEECIAITNGRSMDILEIDGASNRGIDEIRDLREKVRLSPLSAKKKVYIIDEVHMLTNEAFNALLKTIEEPPDHAIFMFCTTEPQKVPATILSRCFHISFKTATPQELVSSFERIVKGEKLEAEKDVLLEIAKLSDGGFRDGAKLMEELALNSKNGKITKELLEKTHHTVSLEQDVASLLSYLAKKDTKQAIERVTKVANSGMDIKFFIQQLLLSLHEQLLSKIGISKNKSQTLEFGIEEIKTLVELLSKAYGEVKYAVLPQLPLEIAIVEWGENKKEKEQVISTPKKKSEGVADSNLDDIWRQMIDKTKTHSNLLAGVLRGGSLKSYNEGKLHIEMKYKFHKERLEEKKSKDILEKVASEIAGNPVEVFVSLKES